jgi:hypothetical protein
MDRTVKHDELTSYTGVNKNLHDMLSMGIKCKPAFRNCDRWVFKAVKIFKLLIASAVIVLLFKAMF